MGKGGMHWCVLKYKITINKKAEAKAKEISQDKHVTANMILLKNLTIALRNSTG